MWLLDKLGASAEQLKKLSTARIADLLEAEVSNSRLRIHELRMRFPSAATREIGQHLIDMKKTAAGMVGGMTGVFGLASVPADLLAMAWLQLSLMTDLATLYGHPPKSERAKSELLERLAYANGVGPMRRSTPKLLGTLAAKLLEKGGMRSLGRAVPLLAAPVSAWLNNRHIQDIGEEALAHYEGFPKARAKARISGSNRSS